MGDAVGLTQPPPPSPPAQDSASSASLAKEDTAVSLVAARGLEPRRSLDAAAPSLLGDGDQSDDETESEMELEWSDGQEEEQERRSLINQNKNENENANENANENENENENMNLIVPAAEQEQSSERQLPNANHSPSYTPLAIARDELFMTIVLQFAPQFATANDEDDVWASIAQDPRCPLPLGSAGVKSHAKWLSQVLATPSRHVYGHLSLKLSRMVLEFLKLHSRNKNTNTNENGHENKNKNKITHANQNENENKNKNNVTETTLLWWTVQTEVDEQLMELVLEKRPFSLDEPAAAATVWAEIAQRVNHPRIHDGHSGLDRVRWLVSVFHSRYHTQHAKLTPKLRQLLKSYVELRGPYQNVAAEVTGLSRNATDITSASPSEPVRKKPRLQETVINAVERNNIQQLLVARTQRLQEQEQKPKQKGAENERPDERSRLMLLEQRILPLVVHNARTLANPQLQRDAWEAIAGHSRGLYVDGRHAATDIEGLVRLLHPTPGNSSEGATLTPHLRAMLARFQELTAAATAASQHTKPPRRTSGSSRSVFIVDAELDELLMNLLLRHRPFDATRWKHRPARWAAVVKGVASPRIQNSNGASNRVRCLVAAYEDPRHLQHARLTPTLRGLLGEYVAIMKLKRQQKRTCGPTTTIAETNSTEQEEKTNECPAETHVVEMASTVEADQSGQGDELEETTVGVAAEIVLVDEEEEEEKEDLPTNVVLCAEQEREPDKVQGDTAKDPNDTETEAEPAVATATATATGMATVDGDDEDELLLREVLRVRPFHAPLGAAQETGLWQRVATRVSSQLSGRTTTGAPVVEATARQCKARTETLLWTARDPTSGLPPHLLEMATLVQRLVALKTNWAAMEMHRTGDYRFLMAWIDTVLKRNAENTVHPRVGSEGEHDRPGNETEGNVEETVEEPQNLEELEQERIRVELVEETQGELQEEFVEEAHLKVVEETAESMADACTHGNQAEGEEENHEETNQETTPEQPKDCQNNGQVTRRCGNGSVAHVRTGIMEEIVEDCGELHVQGYENEGNAHTEADDDATLAAKTVLQTRDSSHDLHKHDQETQPKAVVFPHEAIDLKLRQLDALSTQVTQLRGSNASLADHVQSLQTEVATCRAQLTLQCSRLEHERRDHRAELRTLVEMLQQERESHERATATMLQRFEKEREDRRAEFKDMMDLVLQRTRDTG